MKTIEEISSLRFIFIVIIFLHHTIAYTGGGYLGVEFFFILGGFVMTLGYKDKVSGDSFSYKFYIKKRAAKYYPLHWLCLFFALILSIYKGEFTNNSWWPLLLNAGLVQSWIPLKDVYFSFNGPSWYLADMLFLVGSFPFLCKGVSAILKSKRKTGLIIGLVLLCYIVLFLTTPEEYRHFILFINPVVRLLDFTLGILSAFLYLSLKEKESSLAAVRIPLRILMYICLGVLIVLSLVLSKRYLMCSLAFAPFICALLILASLQPVGGNSLFSWKPIVILGGYSFEIYMIHGVCLRYFDYVKNYLGVTKELLYVPVYLVIVILLAMACRKVFVVPITQHLLKEATS